MYIRLLKKCTIAGKEFKAGTKIGLLSNIGKALIAKKKAELVNTENKEKMKLPLTDLEKTEDLK